MHPNVLLWNSHKLRGGNLFVKYYIHVKGIVGVV
jgi:hypothetical protein